MIEPDFAVYFALTAFIFAFGICVGSFLNVVALRIPAHQNLVFPASHCPHCKAPIKPLYLLPVVGYFFTKGRCAHCKAAVSPLYPIVEAITGLGTVGICFYYFLPLEVVLALQRMVLGDVNWGALLKNKEFFSFLRSIWLFYTAVPLVLIDWKHRILPDRITLPGTVFGFFLGALNPSLGWRESLLGIAVGGGGLFLVAFLYKQLRRRDGMGMGDVKYLAFLGAVLGWQGVVLCLAVASGLGTLYGLSVGILNKQGLAAAIPFGPFLAFGALIVALFGPLIQRILLF